MEWSSSCEEKNITLDELEEYPCLSFEQDSNDSMYLTEDLFSKNQHNRIIMINDRATMLELMKKMLGYTLCSGVISSEYDSKEYVIIPFEYDKKTPDTIMEIGYIVRKHDNLSAVGKAYIDALISYFDKSSSSA